MKTKQRSVVSGIAIICMAAVAICAFVWVGLASAWWWREKVDCEDEA